MVLPSLYGTAFMKNYPAIGEDLFEIDANFYLLSALSAWITISGMKGSATARAGVKSAFADFHNTLSARSHGETTDGRWVNLDDVSSIMKYRVYC
jgi:hypothetical protein